MELHVKSVHQISLQLLWGGVGEGVARPDSSLWSGGKWFSQLRPNINHFTIVSKQGELVRRMGKVMFSVCSHPGGYPSQVRTGGTLARWGWGYPSQVSKGGTLARSGQGGTPVSQDARGHTAHRIASAHSAVLSGGGGYPSPWLGLAGTGVLPSAKTRYPSSGTGTRGTSLHDWDWGIPHLGLGYPPPPTRTGVPPWERIWGTPPPYGGEQTENITFLILRMRVVIISLENWRTLLISYSVLFV